LSVDGDINSFFHTELWLREGDPYDYIEYQLPENKLVLGVEITWRANFGHQSDFLEVNFQIT